MGRIDWYSDFVKIGYKPAKDELVALFYFEPMRGMSKKEVAGRIASESSVGTWTTLPGMPKARIKKLMAKVFSIQGNYLKVAYPIDLWEPGSIAQLMSGVAGNILGMKAVKNLRLLDVKFPKSYLKSFKGPLYGVDSAKKIFKKKGKEQKIITATVIKPKLGYTDKEHAQLAYELYVGGIDAIKDDENLTSQSFNKFERRVRDMAKARDKAEKETGDIKDAFINITSPNFKEMEKRIKLVHDYGFKYFMIDVVLSGFTAVQTATMLARDYKMAIHGHRAMHAAYTRNKKHGVTMQFLAKLMRIAGVDELHTGTIIGKLEGQKEEVLSCRDMMEGKKIKAIKGMRLEQDFYHIKQGMPVASGGLHPGLLHQLFNLYNAKYLVVQVGGGTLGHPKGARAGAMAVKQAIEAYYEGISLKEYAKKHKELAEALKKWGYMKPK